MNVKWSKDDEEKLIECKVSGKANKEIQIIFDGKYSKAQIERKITQLKIGSINHWNDQEIEILYSNQNKPISYLMQILPNRSRSQISYKTSSLGIETTSELGEMWSKDEVDTLVKNQNMTIKELSILLGRNGNSIREKVYRLNLEYAKVNGNRNIGENIQCSKCNTIKEYVNDNFDLKRNICICRECINKLGNITKYRLKYNIYLDFNKMFDTFSPVKWYELYINGRTPKMPQDIYDSHIKKLSIIRHVITNILNKNSREEILSINYQDFIKHKIYNLFNISICSVLNEIFPDYKLKEWEFDIVPSGFWHDKNNADEYLMWFVENKINIKEIDIKIDIPKIFTVHALREIGEHKLNSIIHNYKHYENYYEWLITIFPEWNLQEKDFKTYFSFDGIEFRSREECVVYEYIKKELKINIASTGNRRKGNKYFNRSFNESYYPDFLIKDVTEKPIVIEYFGLFHKNNDAKIFKQYREKTKRKIEFFSNMHNIYFVAFYPEDFYRNFEGIKTKLIKYLTLKGGEMVGQKD